MDRLLLADNSPVEFVLKFNEPLRFGFRKSRYRNLSPVRNNIRYIIFADRKNPSSFGSAYSFAGIRIFLSESFLLLLYFARFLNIAGNNSFFLLFGQSAQLLLFSHHLLQTSDISQSGLGCSLINQINCFIRKTSVIDIAFRKIYGRPQGVVFYHNSVMSLIVRS